MSAPLQQSQRNFGSEPTSPLMTVSEVTRALGLSRSALYRGIDSDHFPYGVHTGPKARRWRTLDILRIQREGYTPGAFASENAAARLVHEQRLQAQAKRRQVQAKAAARKGVRNA